MKIYNRKSFSRPHSHSHTMFSSDDKALSDSTVAPPMSSKERCMQRHDRVRLGIILLALVFMLLSAALFFLTQTILPMLLTTLIFVVLYMSVNNWLRAIEHTF